MAAYEKVDTLIIIPVFICVFLCIHPFDDGNVTLKYQDALKKLVVFIEDYAKPKVKRLVGLDTRCYFDKKLSRENTKKIVDTPLTT